MLYASVVAFDLSLDTIDLTFCICACLPVFLSRSLQVSYYLVDHLNADSAMINTYSAITYLPWCLKIFFGVFSDCVPVFGWHRRPYFISGWVLFILGNIVLWILGSPGTTSKAHHQEAEALSTTR